MPSKFKQLNSGKLSDIPTGIRNLGKQYQIMTHWNRILVLICILVQYTFSFKTPLADHWIKQE